MKVYNFILTYLLDIGMINVDKEELHIIDRMNNVFKMVQGEFVSYASPLSRSLSLSLSPFLPLPSPSPSLPLSPSSVSLHCISLLLFYINILSGLRSWNYFISTAPMCDKYLSLPFLLN